jgi:hypothetical protein
MRTSPWLIVIVLTVANAHLFAQQPPPKQGPIALTIVVDTSWSTEREMPQLRALARQTITSMEVGDYIEVITAHPAKPVIRIAQTIKAGDSKEVTSITTIVDRISSAFLSDATLGKALDIAIQRLDATCAKGRYDHAAIVVFSDGKVTDSDAARIIDLSIVARKKGWPLHFVGTRQTSRTLLVAANQGKLSWSFIGEANPALWLQELRRGSGASNGQEQRVNPAPREDSPTAQNRADTQQPNAPEPSQHESSTVTGKTEAGPTKYSIVTSVDSTVSFLPPGGKTPAASSSTVLPPGSTVEPNALTRRSAEPNEAAQEPNAPAHESTPAQGRERERISYLWWILPPAAALLAFVLYLVSRALGTARHWQTKVRSRLGKTQPSNRQVLVAELNGQSHRLGDLDRFNAIHVGSGPDNTIKVPDKSIASRHLRIYRKGSSLMLRNLAKSPVRLNGSEVKPGGKRGLVVPSVIDLTEKVKLNLRLANQPLTPPATGSVHHETTR